MKTAIIIICSIICVVLSETAVITLLGNVPFELTGNLFRNVVPPVVLTVVAAQALLLGRIYRQKPILYPLMFTTGFCASYILALAALGNPHTDIITYATIVLGSCAVVLGLFWTYRWRKAE
ncbi:MAG: hypothetical protein O3A63_20940 [Proteobacteria bacterium]|nr:hypothetical protein [Pseudomonadota bacterium]